MVTNRGDQSNKKLGSVTYIQPNFLSKSNIPPVQAFLIPQPIAFFANLNQELAMAKQIKHKRLFFVLTFTK